MTVPSKLASSVARRRKIVPPSIGDSLGKLNAVAGATQDVSLRTNLTSLQTEFEQHAQAFETERNGLLAQNAAAQAQIASLNGTIATVQTESARSAATIAALQKKLETKQSATSAKPLDIATSFKSVVDAVQAQARGTPGIGTTISSMQIEVRGVVQVAADGATPVFVFPSVDATVDPAAYSTMRVSFAAVPVVEAPAVPAVPR